MKLFKSKVMPKVTDIFTAEDLQKIRDIVGFNMKNKKYGRYNNMAKTLLQVVDAPEKEFTKREWNGIIYSAGAMTKIEPILEPMLKTAIARFHTFNKK